MEAHAIPPAPLRSSSPLRFAAAGDERLAVLVGRGSEPAFSSIYKRYHQLLFRYCRSMLRNDADAQDALQSTFASAFSALRRGRRDAPLRPWLFRIAHNESISLMRRRRPEQELSELSLAGTISLEERFEERERLALMVADMLELPERQRGALVMRELSGLSHEDIALALETTVNAAKQTIFEARRSLAEFAEGRAMACEDICRIVSDADGRALRSRRVRAHLRQCSSCASFAEAIPERTAQLRALAPPVPMLAAAGIFARALGSGTAHSGEGAGWLGAGAGAGKAAAVIAAKVGAVAVAATAAAGVTAALRQHVPAGRSSDVAHSAAAAAGSHDARSAAAAHALSTAALKQAARQVAASRHHRPSGASVHAAGHGASGARGARGGSLGAPSRHGTTPPTPGAAGRRNSGAHASSQGAKLSPKKSQIHQSRVQPNGGSPSSGGAATGTTNRATGQSTGAGGANPHPVRPEGGIVASVSAAPGSSGVRGPTAPTGTE